MRRSEVKGNRPNGVKPSWLTLFACGFISEICKWFEDGKIRDMEIRYKEIKSAPGGTAIVSDASLKLMNVVGNCIGTHSSSLPAGMSTRSRLRDL
ncbi:hypothetical protein CEXT_34581 [Caerostris extrusa]|uniref:Uncharacterized protein n=1 Tax=Caerostris extrusa TaxID=172846 RepID=A0AAV4XGP1_CAEEX|nr:hypothetical protein CEXT_34581 [Caerostris extrusa]